MYHTTPPLRWHTTEQLRACCAAARRRSHTPHPCPEPRTHPEPQGEGGVVEPELGAPVRQNELAAIVHVSGRLRGQAPPRPVRFGPMGRYLHRNAAQGYTASVAMAAAGEPEALDAHQLDELTQRSAQLAAGERRSDLERVR